MVTDFRSDSLLYCYRSVLHDQRMTTLFTIKKYCYYDYVFYYR